MRKRIERGRHRAAPAVLCVVLCALLGAALGAGAQQSETDKPETYRGTFTDLANEKYLPAVLEEVAAAKKSIVVTMYHIRAYPHRNPSSPPERLLAALVAARKRDVEVRVIFDNSFKYDPKTKAVRVDRWNDTAATRLQRGGVDVRYVSGKHRLHQKLLVIDDDTVILGSHNWTVAALLHNLERSVMLKSKAFAKSMREDISRIELLPPDAQRAPPGSFVPIPMKLLTDPDLGPAIMTTQNERSFDLILYLLKMAAEKTTKPRELTVGLETVGAEIGVDMEMGRVGVRRQMIKVLEKIQNQYGLITVNIPRGAPAEVRLKGIIAPPLQGDCVGVPSGYWQYGWSRKLSHAAKSAYLICLAETEESDEGAWWSESQKELARKYPGNAQTIRRGLRELEKADLVQIVRSSVPPGKGYPDRRPNSYCLEPMLPPEQIAAEWAYLEKAYGREMLAHGRRLATKIDRGNNRAVVANALMAVDEFGLELTEKAVNEVSEMRPDNPCRHMGYVITLLKQWTGKK